MNKLTRALIAFAAATQLLLAAAPFLLPAAASPPLADLLPESERLGEGDSARDVFWICRT